MSRSHSPADSKSSEATSGLADGFEQKIGRYIFLRRLGEGGMGTVDEALDPVLQRKVALKRVKVAESSPTAGATLASRQSAKSLLVQEARTLAKLDHPNIVKVYDAGLVEDGVFVAMELVRGENLRQKMKKERWGWKTWLLVFLQAGQGLAAAHRAQIVHRDFKPDNVMIDDDGRVIVMDFGLAAPGEAVPVLSKEHSSRSLTALPDERSQRSTSLSGMGSSMLVVGGTRAYMPPEQLVGVRITAASDQYAFCISLFEAIFGQRPRRDSASGALHLAALSEPSFAATRKCPRWLLGLLAQGLHDDPEARLPSMDAWIAQAQSHLAQRSALPLIAGLACGLVGATALAHHLTADPRRERCEALAQEIDHLWNIGTAEQVDRTFTLATTSYAGQAAGFVKVAFDQFAESWRDEKTRSCLAAQGQDHRISLRQTDIAACLQRNYEKADKLLTIFTDPTKLQVERSHALIEALPNPTACGERSSDRHFAELELDSPHHQAITAVRTDLEQLAFDVALGKVSQPLEHGQKILERARLLQAPTLVNDVLHVLGRWAEVAANRELSERYRRELYYSSLALGSEFRSFDAASLLMFIAANDKNDIEEAEFEWKPLAQAGMTRMGHLKTPPGSYLSNLAVVYATSRRLDLAIHYFEVALVQTDSTAQDSVVEHLMAVQNLARAFVLAGQFERANRTLEAGLNQARHDLGPGHPELMLPLETLSEIKLNLLEFEQARLLLAEYVRIATSTYGKDEFVGLGVRYKITLTDILEGNQAQARLDLDAFCQIVDKRVGPRYRFGRWERVACARLALAIDDYPYALKHLRKIAGDTDDDPELTKMTYGLHLQAMVKGRQHEAIDAWLRVHRDYACKPKVDDEQQLFSQVALARAYHATGRFHLRDSCLQAHYLLPKSYPFQTQFDAAHVFYDAALAFLESGQLQRAFVWSEEALASAQLAYARTSLSRFCSLTADLAQRLGECPDTRRALAVCLSDESDPALSQPSASQAAQWRTQWPKSAKCTSAAGEGDPERSK